MIKKPPVLTVYLLHDLHAFVHHAHLHRLLARDALGLQDASKKRGYRLVGDVDFDAASKHAGCITPVPGGVGPMTITMLLSNTVDSAARFFKKE